MLCHKLTTVGWHLDKMWLIYLWINVSYQPLFFLNKYLNFSNSGSEMLLTTLRYINTKEEHMLKLLYLLQSECWFSSNAKIKITSFISRWQTSLEFEKLLFLHFYSWDTLGSHFWFSHQPIPQNGSFPIVVGKKWRGKVGSHWISIFVFNASVSAIVTFVWKLCNHNQYCDASLPFWRRAFPLISKLPHFSSTLEEDWSHGSLGKWLGRMRIELCLIGMGHEWISFSLLWFHVEVFVASCKTFWTTWRGAMYKPQ